ncbi:MAG: rhodanese-like domain-containing protein, partial [Verrucomicrobiota bacterium]
PPAELVPDCAQAGVIGVLPGLIGLIQATETIKLILEQGEPLVGRLLLVDALTMQFREMKVHKDPHCAVCGKNPTIRKLVDLPEPCAGPAVPAPAAPGAADATAAELKAKLDRSEKLVVLDVREPHEHAVCRIPGAVLIPLAELGSRVRELDRNCQIIVYCRSGGRSAKAVQILRDAGFRHVRNLKGGILAWSDQVDPSMPRY